MYRVRVRALGLATIALAAIATPPAGSRAADLPPVLAGPRPTDPPPALAGPTAAETRPWGGFWVGAFAGAMQTSADAIVSSHSPGFSGALNAGVVPNAFSAAALSYPLGLAFGYDYQSGSFVYGVLADVSSGLSLGDSYDFVGGAPFGLPSAHSTFTTEISRIGTMRARAGLLLGSDFLAYVTAGLAWAQVEERFHLVADPATSGDFAGAERGLKLGWSVGAGLELAVTEQFSLEAEALYIDLGTRTVALSDPQFPGEGLDYDVAEAGYSFRLGVKYRFSLDGVFGGSSGNSGDDDPFDLPPADPYEPPRPLK